MIPARVTIDAGRAAIVHSDLTEFYLEALQYDELAGAWNVVYGAMATLNTDNDLDLTAPPVFGTLPSTTDPVFFRLWNGIEHIAVVHQCGRTGRAARRHPPRVRRARERQLPRRRLLDLPGARRRDRQPGGADRRRAAGGHRLPPRAAGRDQLDRRGSNTAISGTIEDCRKRFRPLTNQKICCTFLIGDGVSSFGDFNSLEEAAAHLPLAGGELCLLPGLHRANLRLDGRRNVTIHGCARRSLVLPRTETRFDADPAFRRLRRRPRPRPRPADLRRHRGADRGPAGRQLPRRAHPRHAHDRAGALRSAPTRRPSCTSPTTGCTCSTPSTA